MKQETELSDTYSREAQCPHCGHMNQYLFNRKMVTRHTAVPLTCDYCNKGFDDYPARESK